MAVANILKKLYKIFVDDDIYKSKNIKNKEELQIIHNNSIV